MELSIEVHDQSFHGHASFFHSVTIEQQISEDAFLHLRDCLEAERDVIVVFNPTRPGDDMYGYTAEYYTVDFCAKRDMTEWFRELETME